MVSVSVMVLSVYMSSRFRLQFRFFGEIRFFPIKSDLYVISSVNFKRPKKCPACALEDKITSHTQRVCSVFTEVA